jgi:CRISPR-associated protein Csx14
MVWCRAPRERVKVTELRVPMDPLNPGQFFACCGLFELMAKTAPWACAHFVADEARPRRAEFVVEGDGLPQLGTVLGALREATFELMEVTKESVWPVRLSIAGEAFELDWWLDALREKPSKLKCWAGQVTTRKLFADLVRLIEPDGGADRLMTAAKMSKSKFGVDPRSAWNALDFGFSPDKQEQDAVTYPAVEILAAVGLQGFRPRAERREEIVFYLWTTPLPLVVARMGAVAAWDGLPRFDYQFSILPRGQSYNYFAFAKFIERKVYTA